MRYLTLLLALLFSSLSPARAEDVLKGVKRILFLGDSITYAGQYVQDVDAFLAATYPDRDFVVINCGLGSETVSGLSEAGHAGGAFPRPDLHERLDRVLALAKPDLVFANYGMNCGIYQPLDEGRFKAYQDGILWLRASVAKAGARIIHLTPPIYDLGAAKSKSGFDYNDVLDHYAAWLVERGKKDGWQVVDVHSAMARALTEKRKDNAAFTWAKDKVHPDAAGHLVMARSVIETLFPDKLKGFDELFSPASQTAHKPFFQAIAQRNNLTRDSYLTEAGHKRPGVAKGPPVQEALTKIKAMDKTIRETAPKL